MFRCPYESKVGQTILKQALIVRANKLKKFCEASDVTVTEDARNPCRILLKKLMNRGYLLLRHYADWRMMMMTTTWIL